MSSDPSFAKLDDPRGLDLPPSIPALEYVSETTVRVLAPNSSPMTLDGTNTYVVFSPDFASAVVVDPGPPTRSHIDVVESVVAEKDAKIKGILVTHTHLDHSEAVRELVRRWNVKAYAHPNVSYLGYEPVDEGKSVIDEVSLGVIYTPGHSSDHLCFLDQRGDLMSGDHILGRGTTVVAYPDGDLDRYLESLGKLFEVDYRSIQPGHGPSMGKDLGQKVVEYYISHRKVRIAQILEIVSSAQGPLELSELVSSIYGQLSGPILWAAAATTQAAVAYLVARGEVLQRGDAYLLSY